MRKAGSLSWQLLFLCGLVFRPKSRQQEMFPSRSSSSSEELERLGNISCCLLFGRNTKPHRKSNCHESEPAFRIYFVSLGRFRRSGLFSVIERIYSMVVEAR